MIMEMSLKTDNLMTTIITMDFYFFISPSLDTENELQNSHFHHKNLVYVNYLYVGVLFSFHEIESNSHVRKI